jgi:hypothetical protein
MIGAIARVRFDLAMVLRGVASAARLGLIVPDPAVVARDASASTPGRIDGLLNACAPHEPATTLPQRWSTSRGGFLAKAAAGVLVASASLPDVDETVRRSADATYAASLCWAVESPHDDVHPLLYTFEGILALPQHPQFETILPQLASQFDSLLADARALGRIPESRQRATASTGPERLDILAQMIRVGHLLQRTPTATARPIGLARLQQILVQNVRHNGAVPFAVEPRPTQYNAWAAMLAEQALGFVPRDDDLARQRNWPVCWREAAQRRTWPVGCALEAIAIADPPWGSSWQWGGVGTAAAARPLYLAPVLPIISRGCRTGVLAVAAAMA